MAKRPAGRLRIIGGEWRSRRVDFPAEAGVRPTPDRVRQTLFDWLTLQVDGARCLDLFAGSGALGLEALSRGAAHVTFVENGAAQCSAIRDAVARLGAGARAEVRQGDALAFLRGGGLSPYEIVFVDPPFAAKLLPDVLALLPRHLKPDNRIYVEWPEEAVPPWPAGYRLLREKKAGQVSYALATHSGILPA